MKKPIPTFSEQIEAHKKAESVPNTLTTLEVPTGLVYLFDLADVL